ncbi:MAG: TIR domain-containing protein [Gordonia sp. (in: high G+C Gram-positive bacteria)]|uniref:toll/interleukin-1 receptor domain-containing protein n=1 Tax=Gordonia sp. (in: high G+C Gram-positive bacteria) TaxID=84139 RepID=UPI0039E2771F
MNDLVFISYNRADGPAALRLADRLRARGLRVWIDQRSIPVTVPWMKEIEAGIRGAALVVVIDTPRWRQSENCQAEVRAAQFWQVPQLMVWPDSARTVDDVLHRMGQLQGDDDRLRAELYSRAGQWDDTGRPARSLVTGAALIRYTQFLRSRPAGAEPPPVVRAFVRAAATRQSRRKSWRRAGIVLTLVLLMLGVQVYNGFDRSAKQIDEAIESFDRANRYEDAYHVGPYRHLELLSHTESDGEVARWEFARAFSVPLPDAVVPVGRSPLGSVLRARTAETTARSGDRRFRARLTDGGRRIAVTGRDGRLYRSVPLSGRGVALAWTPDDAWLGVAVGAEILLVDVHYRNRPLTLRGAGSPLRAIRAADTGIDALTDAGDVVHWPTPVGAVTASGDGRWTAGAQIPDSDGMLLLTADGRLFTAEVKTGALTRRVDLDLPETGHTGVLALSPDGQTALIAAVDTASSESVVHVVTTSDWSVRRIPVSCAPSDLYLPGPGSVAYVACSSRGVGRLNLRSGDLDVVETDQFATSVGGGDGRLYIGTNFGFVFELDPETLRDRDRVGTGCMQDADPLVVTAGTGHVFTGGHSTANFGCAARIRFDAEKQLDRLAFLLQPVHRSAAVTLSPRDRYIAFGFDDGAVHVFNTADFTVVAVRRPSPQPVRALGFTRDGKTLLSVGRDGHLRRVELTHDDGDNSNQRRRAAHAVEKARGLGLYR